MLARFSQELTQVLRKAPLTGEEFEFIVCLKGILDTASKAISELTFIDREDREVRIQCHYKVMGALQVTASALESVHLRGALTSFHDILQGANKILSAKQIKLSDFTGLEEKVKDENFMAILFAGVYHAELKMHSESAPAKQVSEALEEWDSLARTVDAGLKEIFVSLQKARVGNQIVRVVDDYVPAASEEKEAALKEKEQPKKEKSRAPLGFCMFEDYAGAAPQQAKSTPDELEEPELSDDDDFVIVTSPKNIRKNK